MEFVEPEDEPGLFRNPLPPDDRLWRHPSEVGLPAAMEAGSGGPVPDDGRPSLWLVAAVSAVSAGLLATGLALVVVGLVGTSDSLRPVIERQMQARPIDAVSTAGTGNVVDAAALARAAVAQIRLEGSATVAGSGVIYRSDGYMFTSAAVVGTALSVRVTLESGQELSGRVVGAHPETDVAVVKLDGDGPFPTVVLGAASTLQVGQQAIVIGCPLELAGGPSVTVGVVSALHRTIRRGPEGDKLYDMVQTDTRVPSGWPGGALLDSSGSVVGITTAVGSTPSAAGGFGFAIPIDLVRSVAEQLIMFGRVSSVWLGVQGGDLDWVTAAGLEVTGGAVVGEVMAGSPADRAGLTAQDVILAMDGTPVTTMDQLVVALRRHREGDVVRLDVMRDHERISVVVVLTERSTPA